MSDSQTPTDDTADSIEQEPTSDAADTAATNGEWREPPDDFESDIDTSAATVPDHPVVVDVEGRGEAVAKMLTESDMEGYRDRYGDGEEESVAPAVLAAVLRDMYVEPSFDGLTAEDVFQSPVGFYDSFLQAIAPELFTEGNR